MKGVTQVVLVDPQEGSRQALQSLLAELRTIWLAEHCTSYVQAARTICEIRPDLAIVTIDGDPAQAVSMIQSVVSAWPEAVILPASSTRDPELLLRLMGLGFRRFLSLPTDLNELQKAVDALLQSYSHEQDQSVGNQVIAITGASGGVGCTSLAVNLGTILAQNRGQSVVLADFDLLLGTADTCLDIIPEFTMMDVLKDLNRIDLPLLKRSLVTHSSGLSVLPHPVSMQEAATIDPDDLRRMLMLLKKAFDTVLIDSSKGLQAFDFVAFEMADVILLVIQLEINCVRNSGRLLQLFRQYEGLGERIKVVVNRAGSHSSEIGIRKAEEILGLPLKWQIPNDTRSFQASHARGVPIEQVAPNSKTHRALLEIAAEFKTPPKRDAESVAHTSKAARKGPFAAFF